MKKILLKLFNENNLSSKELLDLLKHMDYEDEELLYKYARETKKRVYNEKIFVRGLIEFSNYCKRDCLYCGLRKSNTKVERYRLSREEILDCCKRGYEFGYRTFVLQSGEDPFYDIDYLCGLVKEIKYNFKGIALTLSIGEKSKEVYQRLFDAGVDRFLLRHETSNTDLYKKLHPNMDFSSRKKCLESLKDIGYQFGAGFMVGLPGQEDKDLVEDLLFLKNIKPHMIGIGPFIPHPDTPIGGEEVGSVEKTLKMIALTRLLLPEVLLPATTAIETLNPNGRERALEVGANVIMLNLSPIDAKINYEIYKGKEFSTDEIEKTYLDIQKRMMKGGLKLDLSRGDHINWRLENDN